MDVKTPAIHQGKRWPMHKTVAKGQEQKKDLVPAGSELQKGAQV